MWVKQILDLLELFLLALSDAVVFILVTSEGILADITIVFNFVDDVRANLEEVSVPLLLQTVEDLATEHHDRNEEGHT